ncbi:unnamed protein product [Dibothriocephalus latus]|uniref:SCP domain-containing protein n=1 Tax=Dibothriocephalus latus TaxID=60516 RepID=A0A3P7LY70_DIBLA|nr:unnamed protein product [Dibothriocephalus latus]
MDRICLLAAFCFMNIVSVELMTQDQKDLIIQYHNSKRSTVNPPASNMQRVVWDENLAELAQKWVNRCKFEHPAYSIVEYRGTGQNIGATSGSEQTTVSEVLKLWYDENEKYNYVNNSCSGICGHYTQVNGPCHL